MEKKRFCHLHLHTEYSLLDSSAKIKKVIPKDYKEVLELVKSNEEKGVTKEQSLVNAFYEKTGKTM